jgi:predicted RND superfamily exporter protein
MVQMHDSPWEVPMGEGHFVEVEDRANEIALELGVTAEFSGIVAISSQDQGKTLGRTRMLTPVSLLLVLFILSRIEPRASYLLAVAAPMILTFIATLGVVGKLTGTITILESIFGIMIFGLGVDFALHLLSRLREEQDSGVDFDTAMTTAITQTGLGVVAGGMTTAGAFFVISSAPDVQALHLGISGGVGLVICLTLMVSMLPATWTLLEKNSKRATPKPMDLGWIQALSMKSEKHYKKTLILGISFITFCAIGFHKHHFESDFEKIVNRDIPAAATGQYIGDLYGLSKSPWMVATDSLDDARAVTTAFEESGDFERVDSITHLIVEDLDERVELLTEAAPTISRLRRSYSSMLPFSPADRASQLNEAIRSLRILEVAASQPPPSPDNLPRALAGQMITPNGQFLVMSYTENLGMDGLIAGEERLTAQAIDERAVGFGMALETLVLGPNEWLIKILWGILAFIITLLFTDQRSLKWMFIALIPVAVGATATLGLMCWAERSFSAVMSLGVLLILGLGVDDGIHIVHRIREDRSIPPSQSAFKVGRAIFMTTLTTCASFAVLLFTDHVGMESMALVLILGLPICLFASISLIPATVTLFDAITAKKAV